MHGGHTPPKIQVSKGLDSDYDSLEVTKDFKDNNKPPQETHTPPRRHHNARSSSNLQNPSDNHSALPAFESRKLSEDVHASASPVFKSNKLSRYSSIPKSTDKLNEPMPKVKRPAWGRAPVSILHAFGFSFNQIHDCGLHFTMCDLSFIFSGR